MQYIEYVQIVTAIYLSIAGNIVTTYNLKSKVVFNWFPIFLSILLMIDAFKSFGLI